MSKSEVWLLLIALFFVAWWCEKNWQSSATAALVQQYGDYDADGAVYVKISAFEWWKAYLWHLSLLPISAVGTTNGLLDGDGKPIPSTSQANGEIPWKF